VFELISLQRQLPQDLALPSPQPLAAACAELEALAARAGAAEAAAAALLARELGGVDWGLLDARLRMREGAAAAGGALAPGSGQDCAHNAGGSPRPECSAACNSPPPKPGEGYAGSPLEAALERLFLSAAALARGQRPPAEAWQEIADDLVAAGEALERRQRADERLRVDVARRDAAALAEALRGLRQAAGGGAA
jgi:hypothetical protein